jgi:hypothetical protein
MDRQTANNQPVDDETAFWRGFITWWAREKAAPVPARAWEALVYAECKRRRVSDTHRALPDWRQS